MKAEGTKAHRHKVGKEMDFARFVIPTKVGIQY